MADNPQSSENCSLCTAGNDRYRLTAENEHAVAVVIFSPVNATHQNIIPRKHVTEINQLTPDEAKGLLDLQYNVQQRLMKLYPEHPPVIAVQTGKLATQPHKHWQVFSSDAHIRLLYARAHEPYYNFIGAKALGWKDNRTHPTVPGTGDSVPEKETNLECFLGEIAYRLRGSGSLEQDRRRLQELSHALLEYNGVKVSTMG